MYRDVDYDKVNEITNRIEKEYDDVYKKFVKTKGVIRRDANQKKVRLTVVATYLIILSVIIFMGTWNIFSACFISVLAFPCIFLAYVEEKNRGIDKYVNRMLVSRVYKDIEYKEYPFVFDKELFFRITKHQFFPTVKNNREIVIDDRDNKRTIRNVEIVGEPDNIHHTVGMFAYTKLNDMKYPRIVIKKKAKNKEPSLDDNIDITYDFNIKVTGTDYYNEKEKIESSDIYEKIVAYTKFFPNTEIYIEGDIISVFCYRVVLGDVNPDDGFYNYFSYGKKSIIDDFNKGEMGIDEYSVKTTKKFNRFNYYKWFGPVKLIEELGKML